jgi:xanthine phosphoribosyltransferase
VDLLKEMIVRKGKVLNSNVLKVDSFINHQMDPVLMYEMGKVFADHFRKQNITKVVTIESSGIAPGIMTALALKVPCVFARKKKPLTLNEELLTTTVYSFTKKEENEISISQKFIDEQDCVLIIDDFLAHGEAALGLAKLTEQAGATVAGIGIVIEKAFQGGRKKLVDAGYEVKSLARIKSLSNSTVEFVEELELEEAAI